MKKIIKSVYSFIRNKVAIIQTYYLSLVGYTNGISRVKLPNNNEVNNLIIKKFQQKSHL